MVSITDVIFDTILMAQKRPKYAVLIWFRIMDINSLIHG